MSNIIMCTKLRGSNVIMGVERSVTDKGGHT